MKKKTGVFVVLDGETFEQAYEKHFDGYTDIEHAKKDMKLENEGTKFRLYNSGAEDMGSFEVKNGEVVEKDE